MTSPAWVSWINCVRLVLVLICCSTLENCTSSLVNCVGVHRAGRILVLQLRHQQLEEIAEIAPTANSARCCRSRCASAAVLALFCCAVTEAMLMGWFPFASCGDVEAAAHPARQRDRRELGIVGVQRARLLPALAGRPAGARHANRRRSARLSPRLARVPVLGSLRGAGSGDATWKVTLRPSGGTPAWSSARCNCGWSRSSSVRVSAFSTVISTRAGASGGRSIRICTWPSSGGSSRIVRRCVPSGRVAAAIPARVPIAKPARQAARGAHVVLSAGRLAAGGNATGGSTGGAGLECGRSRSMHWRRDRCAIDSAVASLARPLRGLRNW